MTTINYSLDDAVARFYARQQEGLPPPVDPHPGYPNLGAAWLAGIRRRDARVDALFGPKPPTAPVPAAAPDPVQLNLLSLLDPSSTG
jgi:hypothetical protein